LQRDSVIEETPATKRDVLNGIKVLVVDDDMRNIFALTSVLENYGVEVLFAENGHDALTTLAKSPDVALVLMDIMMPEMDGYQTTREFARLRPQRLANHCTHCESHDRRPRKMSASRSL
jgi:CheY-like chemotaxis protein